MASKFLPQMRLIDVDIEPDDSGFLVATSRHLPKLLVLATCEEEMATDLAALLCTACEAKFGQPFTVFAVDTAGSSNAGWRCERWAMMPN